MNEAIKINSGNLFSNIPHHMGDEVFDTILAFDGCEIKRIISKGHQSPPDYWYDQERNEWVMVLKGAAALKFKNEDNVRFGLTINFSLRMVIPKIIISHWIRKP